MESDSRKIRKLSKTRKRYFDLAKRAAMESTYGKLRHGAVVVKGGSIVSFGFNKANHCQFGRRLGTFIKVMLHNMQKSLLF